MLRYVLSLALLGLYALALPLLDQIPRNLKVYRRMPNELNHYVHNPIDSAVLSLTLYIGSNDQQMPSLQIDLTKGDLEIVTCNDTTLPSEGVANSCYNPNLSSTFVRLSNITASDRFFSGFPDYDPFDIPNVTFVNVGNAKPGHDEMPGGVSGVMGMGWPAQQRYPDTFFPFAHLQHYQNKMFSLTLGLGGCLGFHLWGRTCAGAEHGAQPHYVPVTSAKYWQFSLNGSKFGTISQTLSAQALVTSTSGYIGMPRKFLQNMMNTYSIPYNGLYSSYVVNCTAELPDFEITVDGKTLKIKASEYVYREQPVKNGLCVVSFEESETYGFGPVWYFGLPLLQAQCLTFDYDNKRIGFTENTAQSQCKK